MCGSEGRAGSSRESTRTVAGNEWTSKTSQTVQSAMGGADDEDGKWKTGGGMLRGLLRTALDVKSWTVAVAREEKVGCLQMVTGHWYSVLGGN